MIYNPKVINRIFCFFFFRKSFWWSGITAFTSTCNSITYGKDNLGNGLWVAVGKDTGTNNTIATSSDGKAWNINSNTIFIDARGIAYKK